MFLYFFEAYLLWLIFFIFLPNFEIQHKIVENDEKNRLIYMKFGTVTKRLVIGTKPSVYSIGYLTKVLMEKMLGGTLAPNSATISCLKQPITLICSQDPLSTETPTPRDRIVRRFALDVLSIDCLPHNRTNVSPRESIVRFCGRSSRSYSTLCAVSFVTLVGWST